MASESDRSRAKRIRRRIVAAKASPTERRWLKDYEDRRDKSKATKVDKAIEAQTAVETTSTPEPSSGTPMATIEFPPEPVVPGQDEDDDSDAKPLLNDSDMGGASGKGEGDAGSSALPPQADSPSAIPTPGLHSSIAPAPVCGNPDCPACSKNVGGSRCAVTGKIVWNPIDDKTAEGSAMMLLGIVGLIVSFVTKKPAVEPTAAEIKYMGEAIQKATYRRINAIGAFDDLIMLGMALGMYANRARLA